MKLSNLQTVLEQCKNAYGDIEVKLYDKELDLDIPFEATTIASVITDEENPYDIKYMRLCINTI